MPARLDLEGRWVNWTRLSKGGRAGWEMCWLSSVVFSDCISVFHLSLLTFHLSESSSSYLQREEVWLPCRTTMRNCLPHKYRNPFSAHVGYILNKTFISNPHLACILAASANVCVVSSNSVGGVPSPYT